MRQAMIGIGLAAALLAGGCARNAVVVERGGRLVAAANPAMQASRDVLADVQKTNREARIELAVTDPQCDWRDPRIAREPAPAGTVICTATGESIAFPLVDAASVRPTVQLIEAVVGVMSDIDDIISEKPDATGAAIEMALVDVNNILAMADSFGKTGQPSLFSDDQIAAASELGALIGQMQKERRQADDLRALRGDVEALTPVLVALRRDVGNWARSTQQANLRTIDLAFQQRELQLRAATGPNAPRSIAADEQFRSLLSRWAAVHDRQRAANTVATEMDKALVGLQKAQAEYAVLLDPNAPLTAEQRRAAARITRQRLSEVLSAVAGALRAFL